MSQRKSGLSELFLTLKSPFKEKNVMSPQAELQSRIHLMNNPNRQIPGQKPSDPNRFMKLATLFFMIAALVLAGRVGILSQKNNNLVQSLVTAQQEKIVLIKKAEKEKANLKQAIENYKKEQESVLFDLKKSNDRLTAVTEEKSYLEEILVNKAREIEDLRGLSPEARAATSGNTNLDDLAKRLKDKEVEISKLNEENRALSKRIEQIYSTTNAKMTEINIAKIALEDTISEARTSIDQQWNTVNLGSIAVPQQQTKTARPSSAKKAPRKDGHVLAVNLSHNFVIVDLGKVDGITQNTSFAIRKNNQTVATLAVLEIRDVMTACNIVNLSAGGNIEINDSVSVLKK